MDFFGFALSVWASIGFGVFFLALIVACTADRNNSAGPKWFVFFVGLLALAIWQWDKMSWSLLTSGEVWKNIGIYVGIGAVYALVEFFFTVRREARDWSERWAHHKAQSGNGTPQKELVKLFCDRNDRRSGIVKVVAINDEVTPVVDRVELSKSLGAWTVFWPGYFVSWALGDLLTEVFCKLANLLASLSGRFVRNTFKGVFKV